MNATFAGAVSSGVIANAVDAGRPVALNTPCHDIEITHRLYADGDGSDLLDIIISNYADTDDSFKLSCLLYLDGESPLRFTQQPEDATVQAGEDVSFSVDVRGGTRPYSFQWQVFNPKTGKWVDLKGYNDAVISRKDVEKKWDGCKFRCVVTDARGEKITSQVATLTVRDKVPTGDDSNLPLYLAVAVIALALLALFRRRARLQH